jgi:ankyrin repeat protein
VRCLLEHNASIDAMDKSGFTALMRASEEGYNEVVAELVQKGANVNCRGFVKGTTPLMLATEKGHLGIIELLLDHGAKINAIDQFEETALSRAYRSNQMKAAELLESRGGRGKPERSAFTFSDSDLRPYTKAAVPQWHGADIDIDEIEEVPDEFGDTDEE